MLNSRNNSSQGIKVLSSPDIPPLTQCLPLDPITLGTQKYNRLGELRRVFGVSLGNTFVYHSFGVGCLKPPRPLAAEELKNYTDTLRDSSKKARGRVRSFGEFILKLDKYMEALSSKKQQRVDLLPNERSGGANFVKMGSQFPRNSNDYATEKLEDKTKTIGLGLKKRIRTSMADLQADGRSTVIPRQHIIMEKDRDALKTGSVNATRVEEKIPRLPAVGGGWEKKMKRKRSVAAVCNRATTGERDTKLSVHPKLHADTKLRSCDAPGFRSRSSQGMSGTEKLEKSFDPANPNSSASLRDELESVSPLEDRTGISGDRAVSKGNEKVSLREENRQDLAGTMTRVKVSRAPKSGSIMTIDSSPNVHPSRGTLESWEQPTSRIKVPALSVANNHNCPVSTGSAHPMAQWVGQRPHKISRPRRANLVAPVFNNDEAQISCQSSIASDLTATVSSHGISKPLLASSVVDTNPKFKRNLENVSSPVGLSGREELRGGPSKLKEKVAAIGGASLSVDNNGGLDMLTSKKNRILVKEDGLQGHGRIGRFFALTRPVVTPTQERFESLRTTRQLESARRGSDKNKSKSGRPPLKKLIDRKPSTRAGHVLSGCSADLPGELDDGEELLLAANSAHKASHRACSSPFWKKMEHLFTSVSSQDASYLKQQLSLAGELNVNLSQIVGDEYNAGAPIPKEVSICSGERQVGRSNEKSVKSDGLCGGFDMGWRLENVSPLYQRVLSALIEDDIEDAYHQIQSASDESHCGSCNHFDFEPKDRDRMESEVESEVDMQIQKHCLLDRISCNKSASSNSYSNRSVSSSVCNGEQWQSDDGFSYCQNDLGGLHASPTNLSSVSSLDNQYQMMSLDDRLLLELHSIGLYPEMMPDLAEGEEGIDKDILNLQERLYQQAGKMKKKLGKIDEAIQCARDVERREVKLVEMNQLVEMAYKKQISCRGSHSSRSVGRRVSKQATLAFVKRTLARCRQFEESGVSCFSDTPPHDDDVMDAPSCNNGAKSVDRVGSGSASNKYNEGCSTKSEARHSAMGVISSTLERHDSHSDKLDVGSSDALPAITHSSEHFKQEAIPNKGKKREILLDDVIGNSHFVGAKAKRSERERDENRGLLMGSIGSDGRSKEKPMQKTNLLSGSQGIGNWRRFSEPSNPLSPPVRGLDRSVANADNVMTRKVELPSPKLNFPPKLSTADNVLTQKVELPSPKINCPPKSPKEVEEEPFNRVNLQTNEDEDCNMLNFDEDGLADWDGIGLDMPMDDLSDIF